MVRQGLIAGSCLHVIIDGADVGPCMNRKWEWDVGRGCFSLTLGRRWAKAEAPIKFGPCVRPRRDSPAPRLSLNGDRWCGGAFAIRSSLGMLAPGLPLSRCGFTLQDRGKSLQHQVPRRIWNGLSLSEVRKALDHTVCRAAALTRMMNHGMPLGRCRRCCHVLARPIPLLRKRWPP